MSPFKTAQVMRNGNSNSNENSTGVDPTKATPRSNMSGLSSYCMKTVVMNLLKAGNDPKDWSESNSVELLFKVKFPCLYLGSLPAITVPSPTGITQWIKLSHVMPAAGV